MIETAAIIPAYNEQERIGNVVSAALRSECIDAVVIVDDGSSDLTTEYAQEAIFNSPHVAAKSVGILSHSTNLGKTEALRTGVDCAKALGSTTLRTLVFLDADSSPVWSRDTVTNMKLWQLAVQKISKSAPDSLDDATLTGRETAFTTLLARYIDEIVEPVKSGDQIMRSGMYQRNIVTDTLLTATKWGGHAGNRAIPVSVWDDLMAVLAERDQSLSPWEIEGALNSYVNSIEDEQGVFMMHGIVNVGSRVKAGGFIAGLRRMTRIHAQAFRGTAKINELMK